MRTILKSRTGKHTTTPLRTPEPTSAELADEVSERLVGKVIENMTEDELDQLEVALVERRAAAQRDSGPELINHPKHYNLHPSGVECIDIIEHFTANVSAAVKYLWRAGLKLSGDDKVHEDPFEARMRDLKKAAWYVDREIDKLNRDRAAGRI